VAPREIEANSLPWWIAGCKSIQKPHPTVVQHLAGIGTEELIVKRTIHNTCNLMIQTFYHIAALGDWKKVLDEQLALTVSTGLAQNPIFTTFVGKAEDLDWAWRRSKERNVHLKVVQSDPNTAHFETFAMLAIERWAKTAGDACALYLHTKGVSAPGHNGKRRWRHLMQDELIRKWKEHIERMDEYDAIGVNWRGRPFPPHFCGNFWMARASYLRTLEDFKTYHNRNNLERTNCEFWIGTGKPEPKVLSLVHQDTDYCSPEYFG